jgi:hypothetical protein
MQKIDINNSDLTTNESNYFRQEWLPGTLKTQTTELYIDEKSNPTSENENEFANKLQNYYIYKPLDSSVDSILNATSFYVPNHKLFNILEVFKPLDQGHDFYTTTRNVKPNWTIPPKQKYSLTDKKDNLTNYIQFQANTSFGGGSGIFGLILINDKSYEFLKQGTDQLDINKLLELVNKNISSNIDEYGNIDAFTKEYGKEIVFSSVNGELIINNDTINNDTINNDADDIGKITILSIYSIGYDSGLHKLWDFEEKNHVYSVLINNNETTFSFSGYNLYDCNIVIEENIIVINDLINKYKNQYNQTDNTSLAKKIIKNDINEISDIKKNITEILSSDDQLYNFEFKYGYCLKLVECINNPANLKIITEFFIKHIFNYYYTKHPLSISDEFNPFDESDIDFINEHKNTNESTSKLPVSIPDASTGPSTEILLGSLSNNDIALYPHEYSIVSANVDGSKLGGQITTSYHPPELSIYMTLFDKNNNFYGFIYRICFLKKIFSNKLNAKSSTSVDMHYCFFYIKDFSNEKLIGDKLDGIKNFSEIVTEHILKNTTIDNYNLNTSIPNKSTKKWHKFTLNSEAPSVEEINKYVKSMSTKMPKILEKINPSIQQNTFTLTNMLTQTGQQVSQFIKSLVNGSDPLAIDSIVEIGIKIWLDDEQIFKEIYEDNNETTNKISNNFINFIKIFLIRNKYIGDNSRASDTLFNNKEMIINPIQFSNDLNTLSTAKMVNISSMLAPPASSKILFLAPYMNEKGKYIRSNFNNDDGSERKLSIDLTTKQDSSDMESGLKPKPKKIVLVDEELIVSGPRERKKPSQHAGMQGINRKTDRSGERIMLDSSLLNQKQMYPMPYAKKQKTTDIPFNFTPQKTAIDLGQGLKNITDRNMNYLQNIYKSFNESRNYINLPDINSFVVKEYLDYINENMKYFSKSLDLQGFIDLIKQTDANRSLFIKKNYSTFLRELEKINGLVIMGSYVQEEDIQEESNKIPFDFLINKLNNLFYFTEQRVSILNKCVDNFDTEMNYYNNVIIPIYDYLYGYYYDEFLIEIDYTDEASDDMTMTTDADGYKINKNGMITFIGLYYFFIYFTIEFNNKLNEKFANLTKLDSSKYLNNSLVEQWLKLYIDENGVNLGEVIGMISGLNYGSYINLSIDSDNVVNPILQDINKDGIIFTDSYNLAVKSLYFLLDDNFVEEYLKNNYPNGYQDDINNFLDKLYKNNLSGLAFGNKLQFYRSDAMRKNMGELIDLYNKNFNKEDETKMDTSGGSYSLKNRKKYKIRRTLNKKTKNTKRKTLKKYMKKRRYTKRK